MASVAGIALRRAEFAASLAEFDNLTQGLVANLMAAAAALFTFGHCHGLPVDRRHGFHGRPRDGVLALVELCDLGFVAGGAGFRRGNLDLGHVGGGGMLVAVAGDAGHIHLAMLAELPVGDDAGSDLAMTLDTLNGGRLTRGQQRRNDRNRKER